MGWTMATVISARHASRNFLKVLRDVEGGAEFVVMRNGEPVARIIPETGDGTRRLSPAQEKVLARSMARLRRGWSLGGGRVDRQSLFNLD